MTAEVEGGALPLDQALLSTQIQGPAFLEGLHGLVEEQQIVALVASVAALIVTLALVFLGLHREPDDVDATCCLLILSAIFIHEAPVNFSYPSCV